MLSEQSSKCLDTRIKTSSSRYDNGVYTRMQFLNAVSHSVDAHGDELCEVDNPSESDDETDDDAAAAEPQELPPAALCDVCLIQPRESHLVLFPCGHCRFCESLCK